ncbi:aminomethyltransferase family protein [Cribrihabitans sp. XS_ASV171]
MPKDRTTRGPHPNHPTVDQSDRHVPVNLRQSGQTPVEMLISTRVRKSPFWHLSVEAGAWRATIYNRMYHPRGYIRPEDGGAMAEYRALMNGVTLWDVAVERQIRVRGPEAEAFVNAVITRDATRIEPMHGKYCILCNEQGGIVNDPVLLRIAEDEFWFSLSDSDLKLWLDGVNTPRRWEVDIDEIDVCPLQIQGPRSVELMAELVDDGIRDMPYYGLMEAEIAGCSVVVSRTGFSGEEGFEIYLRDASAHAEAVWHAIRGAGAPYGLQVVAPAHHRRIAAGILSYGQDMDIETSPFQVNLAYQVPRKKVADYVGRSALEEQRRRIEAGEYPFALKLVGLKLGGKPITDYAPDFWLIQDEEGTVIGYVTSPWHSPDLGTNIALGYVPNAFTEIGTPLKVALPEPYAEEAGAAVSAQVAEVPFVPSAHPSAREQARSRGRESPE